jgi:hypothetical protein
MPQTGLRQGVSGKRRPDSRFGQRPQSAQEPSDTPAWTRDRMRRRVSGTTCVSTMDSTGGFGSARGATLVQCGTQQRWKQSLGAISVLLAVVASPGKTQACQGLSASRVTLVGSIRFEQEVRVATAEPIWRFGALFVSPSLSSVAPRASLRTNRKLGLGAVVLLPKVLPVAWELCGLIGTNHTAPDGATITEGWLGAGVGSPKGVPIPLLSRAYPFASFALHRERTRFAPIPNAGDDYARYDHSDWFGSIALGLGFHVADHIVFRALLDSPWGTKAHTLGVVFGAGVFFGPARTGS